MPAFGSSIWHLTGWAKRNGYPCTVHNFTGGDEKRGEVHFGWLWLFGKNHTTE
jgi:hypothetical protein